MPKAVPPRSIILNESVGSAAEAEREVTEYLRHTLAESTKPASTRTSRSSSRSLVWVSILNWPTRTRARLLKRPSGRGNFVRVDMEDSNVTQVTIDIFKRLRAEFGLNDVGIVLQSYLRRTYADAQELVKLPARIRICKGAYNEPPEVAFPDKKDVDENYVQGDAVVVVERHLSRHRDSRSEDDRCHDRLCEREGIGKEKFEFQMLYGVRRDLQRQLARDGYNVRVYVPYGKHWYPYFMRRLAERPANIWFVLKNLLKG